MKSLSKGMAYFAAVSGMIIMIAGAYGFSLLDISLYRTYYMGYIGLLIRTGWYAVFLAAAIWGLIRWRKADERKLRRVIAVFVAMVLFMMIVTVRDLFASPVTRNFEVYFYTSDSRGFPQHLQMLATPLNGDGKNERFYTTRSEIIEGLPRYSRRNVPQGHYKMRITYYPHSCTRVSTKLIGGDR